MLPKIVVTLDTRPEIIKMAPIIRACQHAKADYSVLHTGQHYSYAMDRIFFEQLYLPLPAHNLDAGSGRQGAQTAKILAGIEEVVADDFVDRHFPPGIPAGPAGVRQFFTQLLPGIVVPAAVVAHGGEVLMGTLRWEKERAERVASRSTAANADHAEDGRRHDPTPQGSDHPPQTSSIPTENIRSRS